MPKPSNAPRPYDLTKAEEITRLIRETRGYLHACKGSHHGTDFEGRAYAIQAFDAMIKAGAPVQNDDGPHNAHLNGQPRPLDTIEVEHAQLVCVVCGEELYDKANLTESRPIGFVYYDAGDKKTPATPPTQYFVCAECAKDDRGCRRPHICPHCSGPMNYDYAENAWRCYKCGVFEGEQDEENADGEGTGEQHAGNSPH